MTSFWLGWPGLRARVREARQTLVLLDFDGTLSRLVRNPSRARLLPGIRYLLLKLAALPRTRVAVLSGRSMPSLRAGVNMRRVYLGGNHGLEIRGPGLEFHHPRARTLAPLLRAVAGDVRRGVADIPGAFVEDKGVSFTLHFRNVRSLHAPALARAVGLLRAKTAGFPVHWREGKKVWEVVPGVPWRKGEAALHLQRHFGAPLTVAVGDDVTDEDMFRAVNGSGITVRVGYRADSAAQFYLNRQRDILRFLRVLHDELALDRPEA